MGREQHEREVRGVDGRGKLTLSQPDFAFSKSAKGTMATSATLQEEECQYWKK